MSDDCASSSSNISDDCASTLTFEEFKQRFALAQVRNMIDGKSAFVGLVSYVLDRQISWLEIYRKHLARNEPIPLNPVEYRCVIENYMCDMQRFTGIEAPFSHNGTHHFGGWAWADTPTETRDELRKNIKTLEAEVQGLKAQLAGAKAACDQLLCSAEEDGESD